MKKLFKRTLAIFLAVVMTFGVAPLDGLVGLDLPEIGSIFSTKAEAAKEFEEGNYTYTVDEDGNATITSVTSYISGDVSIPSTLGGYTVTKIGSKVFYLRDDITSVIIPDSVTSIGYNAFYECESLTIVKIGKSVTNIGDSAFTWCSSLTDVIIPNSVESIGDGAFSLCGLTSVTIGNGVKSIGERAFSSCSKLTSVTIPASVTSIGYRAFSGLGSLDGNEGLMAINVAPSNTAYSSDSNGVLFNKNKTELIQYPPANSKTSYDIPNSVTSIGDYAFYECKNLSSITIPDGVTSIGEHGFYNCNKLTSIVIPDGVTNIADSTFTWCQKLSSITIPDSVTNIGEYAFGYCYRLRSITIPDSVTSIGYLAFVDSGLSSIVIPDSVTNYGQVIFSGCKSLTSVTIGKGAKEIGSAMFDGCSNLTSVIIPDTVTEISDGAFRNCYNLKNISLHDGINSIGSEAFYGTGLSSWENDVLYIDNYLIDVRTSISGAYSIKEGTKLIAGSAFEDCNNLTSITMPDSVITIGYGAFSGCENLESVTISACVENLDNYTFEDCISLTSITIPDSVTNIGYFAFNGCDSLVSADIGNSVTSIGERAFEGCDNLTSITIPNSVTSIGDEAFNECGSLTSVTIGNGVTSIGYETFCDCKNLINVTIGNSVSDIGDYAFGGCNSLASIMIPDSVTNISSSAFASCTGLAAITVGTANTAYSSDEYGVLFNKDKTLLIKYPTGNNRTGYTIPDSVTEINKSAFEGCIALEKITIPDNVLCIGRYAFECCTGLTNVIIGSGVTSIEDGAFIGCSGLVSLKISDSNSSMSIGHMAFDSCTSLTDVTIGNGVTSIDSYAFQWCNSLTEITIPDSVTYIGSYAFIYCKNLIDISFGNGLTEIGSSILYETGYYKDQTNWKYGSLYINNYLIGSDYNQILETYEIKEGTKVIAAHALYAQNLTSVIIPDSIISISDQAFGSCDSLTDVYYTGTEEKWNAISISSNNEYLTNATIHYKYVPEDEPTQPDTPKDIILTSSNPTNGEKYFSLEKDIVLTFSQKIEGVSVDTISIKDYETDKVVCKAGVNCIEKNGNTLTLKHMVHTPIVDENGKTVEGGKLKGNMKYYINIPDDAIRFADGYYKGTASKDDLAFSTYISKDRSLEKYGFKQEYTEGDLESEKKSNERIEGKYLNSKGKALNNLCVPGLKEGMVPQGLTYYREKGWYLISAYHKSDLPDEEKNNSVIYALNKSGEFVAQFNFHNEYGEKSLIHAGGVAVGKHNLYLTFGGRKIAYLPLSELNVPAGTVKDICIRDSVWLGKLDEGTKTSYLNFSGDILWTGNFYCPAWEAYLGGMSSAKIPASKGKANSIMLGYKLSGTDSLSEWNSFSKTVKQNDGNKGATYTIYLPDDYDGVQGATVHIDEATNKGTIFLSRAKYRPFVKTAANSIAAHEISMDSSEIVLSDKNWTVIKNLPGGENIFIEGGKMYCVYEASALAEIGLGGAVLWNTQVETDVIWEIDVKDMLKNTKQGTVNCPVDVEIYDEDTGELVGRIKDNVVDYEIVDKENGVLMDVDGDTKYYWLDAGKNYKVVLIGNDSGKMDYSVSIFDENAQIVERTNFYDVKLTDGLTYSSDIKSTESSLSGYNLVTKDGSKISPDKYYSDINDAKATVTVSVEGKGTATESFVAICGDFVKLSATPDKGYVFAGWYENNKLISDTAEFSFVMKEDRNIVAKFSEEFTTKPSEPTTKPVTPPVTDIKAMVEIRKPSQTEIKYGDSIILHADVDKVPEGGKIVWTADNSNFSFTVSADGSTCTITPASNGDTTFTATIYDAKGNEISKDTQTMTSKAGFFQKIIAFFKKLFGMTKVIPEAFKGIF